MALHSTMFLTPTKRAYKVKTTWCIRIIAKHSSASLVDEESQPCTWINMCCLPSNVQSLQQIMSGYFCTVACQHATPLHKLRNMRVHGLTKAHHRPVPSEKTIGQSSQCLQWVPRFARTTHQSASRQTLASCAENSTAATPGCSGSC